MTQSFLFHRHSRYFKISLALIVFTLLLYAVHDEPGFPNGGTWLGYALGGIGTALTLWLMWFGARKRSYHSSVGTLHGWLSAHVHLGIALVFVVTLHAGFQFGWNIHTLAYVLMMLAVVSGSYGVFAYLRYPQLISKNEAGVTRDIMLREIFDLERECLFLSDGLHEEVHQVLVHAIDHTTLGGSLWQRLMPVETQRDKRKTRQVLLALKKRHEDEPRMDEEYDPNYDATMFIIADRITHTANIEKVERMRRLLELLGRRNILVKRLRLSIRYQTLMELWLAVHVPLSFALLAAIIVHVVTVFLYW
ncbi:MAG: hypothetical protein GY862_30755 [Gammaproteobacteria bacterium]|nr:hypothetical protein [Gammaproteobacteria bacterium]